MFQSSGTWGVAETKSSQSRYRNDKSFLQDEIRNLNREYTMFELALAAGLKLRGVGVELGEPTDFLSTSPAVNTAFRGIGLG